MTRRGPARFELAGDTPSSEVLTALVGEQLRAGHLRVLGVGPATAWDALPAPPAAPTDLRHGTLVVIVAVVAPES